MTDRNSAAKLGKEIRSLFSVGAMGAMSDRELLEHYAHSGESAEPAFAVLVERHGPMVLRVCRNLLGDCDLAGDSFQVTFLLLARRSESIRHPEALGGWLHRVARRVALRARAGAARRRRMAPIRLAEIPVPADDRLERDEVCAIVHEEIDRLDDGLRMPLVLCALEGLTHEEAARRLRWPVGTVKSRLVRGRRRLKGRLTRRGLAPAAALAYASGAQASVSMTVPLALALAATRIAGCGGACGAVGFTSSATWLLGQVLNEMRLAKLKLGAASLLAGAAAMMIGVALAGPLGERVRAPAQEAAKAQEPAVRPQVSSERNNESSGNVRQAVKLSANGRVVDAGGRPVAGAKVFIRERAILRTMGSSMDESEKRLRGAEIPDILARTTTDENGRFGFQNVEAPPFRHITVDGKGYYPWDVVAIAPGHGVAWTQLTRSKQRTEIVLALPPERSLHGRLVEPGGEPIAGARIKVFGIYPLGYLDTRDQDEPGHLDLTWSSIPLVSASAADGTFTVRGLPREIQTCLVITEAHHERKVVYAATTGGPQPQISDRRLNQGQPGAESDPVYTDGFTITLSALDHRLLGRVLLDPTGAAAGGTRVRWNRSQVVADALGSFLLENLPAGEIELRLFPPTAEAAPFATRVTLPEETKELERTFRLPAGMLITGRAVDAESVAGIGDVELMYRPGLEPGQQPKDIIIAARTEVDGRYRLAVPPGRGALQLRNIPGPWFKLSGSRDEARFTRNVSGKAGDTLDLPPYRLVRDQAIVVKVRDAEGRPVAGAEVVYPARLGLDHSPARTDATGRCELHGVDHENGFTLDVTHPSQPLGARVVVQSDDADIAKRNTTIEVTLKPCGSLIGRVVDDDGRPIDYAVVRLYAGIGSPDSAKSRLISVDVRDDGTFMFDRLIAGLSYRINILGDEHATWLGDTTTAIPRGSQNLGEIRLPRADQFLSGVVVDARGQAISGATVGYERDPPRDEIFLPQGCHWFRQTDAHGRFRLSGLPRGTIKLVAFRPTEGRSVRHMIHTQARAGETDVRIVVPDVDERLRGIE
jgi:RNA polymerase sigma factor (sigma-70 family)